MNKLLTQHKWQAFVLDEIFDIRATKSSIDKKNLVNLVGTIPYITRSDKNNGIDMFIGEQPKYKKDEGNVLTIGLDTQTIFYQPLPFYTGQNIQVIRHPRIIGTTPRSLLWQLKFCCKSLIGVVMVQH